jgi:hypothetical protein
MNFKNQLSILKHKVWQLSSGTQKASRQLKKHKQIISKKTIILLQKRSKYVHWKKAWFTKDNLNWMEMIILVKIRISLSKKILRLKKLWRFLSNWNVNHQVVSIKKISSNSKVFQLELQKNSQKKHISSKIFR